MKKTKKIYINIKYNARLFSYVVSTENKLSDNTTVSIHLFEVCFYNTTKIPHVALKRTKSPLLRNAKHRCDLTLF